jgi:hypothetical protein
MTESYPSPGPNPMHPRVEVAVVGEDAEVAVVDDDPVIAALVKHVLGKLILLDVSMRQAIALGATGYLAKPLNIRLLLDRTRPLMR